MILIQGKSFQQQCCIRLKYETSLWYLHQTLTYQDKERRLKVTIQFFSNFYICRSYTIKFLHVKRLII